MPRIVFVTDLHLTEGLDSRRRFAGDMDELMRLDPRPDLLIMGGDISLESPGAADCFDELTAACPLPILPIMGNHDATLGESAPPVGQAFEARYNPVNQHRVLDRAHIITLNTCQPAPEYFHLRDWHRIKGLVAEPDLRWLQTELSTITDRTAPLLLFVHIPLLSTYPERRGATPADCDVWRVINNEQVLDLLAPFDNVLVAQGHLHENEHLYRPGLHAVSVGAIAGAWWSRSGFAECPDGSPRGYLIIDVDDDDVQLHYQAAGCAPTYQACTFTQDGQTYLNIFFGDGNQPVYPADRPSEPLPPARGLLLRDGWTSTHLWTLPPDMPAENLTVHTSLRGRSITLSDIPHLDDFMASPDDRQLK